MPTYTYECKKCLFIFDKYSFTTDPKLIACPDCGGGCRRLIGLGGKLTFKGSGFYETDYKKKST